MSSYSLKPNHHHQLYDDGQQLHLLGQDQTFEPLEDLHIPENASLKYYFAWYNQNLDRLLRFHLDGPQAHAECIGLLQLEADHRVNLTSVIIHHAPHTTGNTLIKGSLNHKAQAYLDSMIKIDPGAQDSDDYLTERLMYLSNTAFGDIRPQLEIEANDVKASHSSTISQPDEFELFYLQSRGVHQDQARQMIVDGFFREVLDLFPPAVTAYLS
jgi:Fe-S cluster assembly scaffold protein SufB